MGNEKGGGRAMVRPGTVTGPLYRWLVLRASLELCGGPWSVCRNARRKVARRWIRVPRIVLLQHAALRRYR